MEGGGHQHSENPEPYTLLFAFIVLSLHRYPACEDCSAGTFTSPMLVDSDDCELDKLLFVATKLRPHCRVADLRVRNKKDSLCHSTTTSLKQQTNKSKIGNCRKLQLARPHARAPARLLRTVRQPTAARARHGRGRRAAA